VHQGFSKFLLTAALIATLSSAPAHAGSGGTLLGLAAGAAVLSTIPIAGIQAGADKDIAKIEANTQVAITGMQAQSSQTIAAMQSQTALALSSIAAATQIGASQAVTTRLGMQLSEQRAARELQAQLDAQLQADQYALANRRLDVEEKMAAMQAQIAAMTSGSQPVASFDSGASLSVSSYGMARPSQGVDSASRLLASVDSTSTNAQAGQGFAPQVASGTLRGALAPQPSRVQNVGVPRGLASVGNNDLGERHAASPRALYAAGDAGEASGHGHGGHSGHGHSHGGGESNAGAVVRIGR